MSYEGYERWLCKNGHYWEFDAYGAPHSKTWKCMIHGCGQPVEWIENVDTTNDNGNPITLTIDKPVVVLNPCKHCGRGDLSIVTYRIPNTKSGRRV